MSTTRTIQMTGKAKYSWHSIISQNSLINTVNRRVLEVSGNNVYLADQAFHLLSQLSYINSLASYFCPDLTGTWRTSDWTALSSALQPPLLPTPKFRAIWKPI